MLVDMCLLNLIKELCNTTHCQTPKAIRIEKVLYKKANNSKFKVMSYKKWETNVILLILRRGEESGGQLKVLLLNGFLGNFWMMWSRDSFAKNRVTVHSALQTIELSNG